MDITVGQPEGKKIWVTRLLTVCGLAQGGREARRLLDQGAVLLDGVKVTDPEAEVELHDGMHVQVGRTKLARIHLSTVV